MLYKMSDLVVETMDHCFLCLDPVQQLPLVKLETGHVSDSQDSVHSLKYLSQYLKMDMRKVLLDKEPTTNPHLLDEVVESNLKVKLCENCVSLSDRFSKLYKQLEKIQSKITSCIGLIHGKLTDGEKTAKAENFRKITMDCDEHAPDELKAKIKIADVLRMEAMTKCLENLSAAKPKAQIENLSLEQLKKKALKLKVATSQNQAILKPFVKMYMKQVVQNDPDSIEDDDSNQSCSQSGEDKYDMEEPEDMDMGDDDYHPDEPTITSEPEETVTLRGDVDPVSGRVKCTICPQTFKNQKNFRNHHKNIHLGLRHCCTSCDQKFKHRASLNRHKRTVHQGIKPECRKCHRKFDYSSQLQEHQSRTSCESIQPARCKCEICGLEVGSHNIKRHMSWAHSKQRNNRQKPSID